MQFVPGSIVLAHRPGIVPRLIVWGQRFRGTSKYAHWSHVAVVVSKDGDIVEALTRGVVRDSICKYENVEHVVIVPRDVADDPAVQERVARFAEHAVGRRYGFAEIGSLFLYLLTGTKFRFGIDNQLICSGLAAEALSRSDAIFPHEPMFMMPADLAAYYTL